MRAAAYAASAPRHCAAMKAGASCGRMPAKVFDSERAIVPLFETEIRGVPMLKGLRDAIFADAPLKPASLRLDRRVSGAAAEPPLDVFARRL